MRICLASHKLKEGCYDKKFGNEKYYGLVDGCFFVSGICGGKPHREQHHSKS